MKTRTLFFAIAVAVFIMASCTEFKKTKTVTDDYQYQTSDSVSPKCHACIENGQVMVTYGDAKEPITFQLNLNGDSAKGVFIDGGNCYVITSKNELVWWKPCTWTEEDGVFPRLVRRADAKFKGVHAFRNDSIVNDYGFAIPKVMALDANGQVLGEVDNMPVINFFGGFEGTFATLLEIEDGYIMFRNEETKEIYEGYCKLLSSPDDIINLGVNEKPYTFSFEFVSHIPSPSEGTQKCSHKGKFVLQSNSSGGIDMTPLEGFAFIGKLNEKIGMSTTW